MSKIINLIQITNKFDTLTNPTSTAKIRNDFPLTPLRAFIGSGVYNFGSLIETI